jgi:hypothetical protein
MDQCWSVNEPTVQVLWKEPICYSKINFHHKPKNLEEVTIQKVVFVVMNQVTGGRLLIIENS